MSLLTTSNEWESRFATRPENALGYTQVTCVHSVHGTVIFYVSSDMFQDNIRALLSPYWVNAFTIVMTPMEGVAA